MMAGEKRITEGNKVLSNGHSLYYVQTSFVGWFAKVESTSTEYICSCGRSKYTPTRFLMKELDSHDAWKTPEQRTADSNAFAAMMDEMFSKISA